MARLNSSPRRCTQHVNDTLSFRLTMPAVSLSAAVQDTTPAAVLSWCWCSLTLAITTHMGLWDGAGATRSWFLVLQLSYFCRISSMLGEVPLSPLRSFVRTLSLIVMYLSWFTIDRFFHKITIFMSSWRVERKNHCFLVNWLSWALCYQSLFRLDDNLFVDLCILVPLCDAFATLRVCS